MRRPEIRFMILEIKASGPNMYSSKEHPLSFASEREAQQWIDKQLFPKRFSIVKHIVMVHEYFGDIS